MLSTCCIEVLGNRREEVLLLIIIIIDETVESMMLKEMMSYLNIISRLRLPFQFVPFRPNEYFEMEEKGVEWNGIEDNQKGFLSRSNNNTNKSILRLN